MSVIYYSPDVDGGSGDNFSTHLCVLFSKGKEFDLIQWKPSVALYSHKTTKQNKKQKKKHKMLSPKYDKLVYLLL